MTPCLQVAACMQLQQHHSHSRCPAGVSHANRGLDGARCSRQALTQVRSELFQLRRQILLLLQGFLSLQRKQRRAGKQPEKLWTFAAHQPTKRFHFILVTGKMCLNFIYHFSRLKAGCTIMLYLQILNTILFIRRLLVAK